MGEYRPDTIVWVKWKRHFWPAKVVSDDSLPEDLRSTIKGSPVACIKFLNEDFYDIIYEKKKLQRYICAEKYNYIKQGIEIKDSEDLEMFKEAVRMAEEEISGNPNIIDCEEMRKKEPKPSEKYKQIFPSASDKKKKRKLENEEESASKKTKTDDFNRSKYYEVIYFPPVDDVNTEPLSPEPISNWTSLCPECGYRSTFVENAVMHYRAHYDKSFDFRKYINYRQTYSLAGKKRKSKKASAKKVSVKKDASAEDGEPVSKKKPKLIGKELKKQLLEDWEEEEARQTEEVEEVVEEERKDDQLMESSDAAFDALLADTQVPVIPKAPLPLPARDDYEFIESDEDRISTAGDYFSQWCQGAQSDDDEDEAADPRLESGPVTPVMEDDSGSNKDDDSPDFEDDESCEVVLHKDDVAPPEYEDISEVEQNPEMSDSDAGSDVKETESKDEDSINLQNAKETVTEDASNKGINEINNSELQELDQDSNPNTKGTNEVKPWALDDFKESSESSNSSNKESEGVKEIQVMSETFVDSEESNQALTFGTKDRDKVKEMENGSKKLDDFEETNQALTFGKKDSDEVKEMESRSEKLDDFEESNQASTFGTKDSDEVKEIESRSEKLDDFEESNQTSTFGTKDSDEVKEIESRSEKLDDFEESNQASTFGTKDSDEVKEMESRSEKLDDFEESNQTSTFGKKDRDEVKQMESRSAKFDEFEESNQASTIGTKDSDEVKEMESRSEKSNEFEELNQDSNSSSKDNNNAQGAGNNCEAFVELEDSTLSNKAKEVDSKSETSVERESTTERTTVSDEEKKSSSKKLLERFLKEQEQRNAQQKVQSEDEVPEVLEVTEVQEDVVCLSASPHSIEDKDDVIVVPSTTSGAPVENGVVDVDDDSREEDNDDVMIIANDSEEVVTVMDDESNTASEEVAIIFGENKVTPMEDSSSDVQCCDEALDLRNRSSRASRDSKWSHHNHHTEEEALDCSYKGKDGKSVPSPDCEYVSDSEEEPDEATIQSFKMASLREDVESAKDDVVTINEEDSNYILIEIDESGSISISQDENEKSSDRLQPRL